MSRWKKLLLGLAVTGVVISLILGLLVKIFVTPERVHWLLQEGLENSLGRKVSLGRVEVGLFRGIKLEGLNIHTRNAKESLLSAENIELSYDLPALFRGELLFGKILIKQPQLRLVREANGQLNIADLLGRQTEGLAAAGHEKVESGAVLPLVVKQFSIQGGKLLFVDRQLNPKSPYLYRLEKLDLEIEDFSLTKPFVAHMGAILNDSNLAAKLSFDLATGFQEMQLRIEQLNLVPFMPYLQLILPGRLEQGLLSTEINLTRQTEGLAVTGRILLDRLDASLDVDHSLQWQDVRVAIDQELLYRFSDQILEFKQLKLDIDGAELGYRGKISFAEPLQLAGEASLVVAQLRNISKLMPSELAQLISSYAVAGSLDATLQLEGQPLDVGIVRKAKLSVSGLQASFGALRPALSGTMNYIDGRLSGQKLQLDINGQQLDLDLAVTNLRKARPQIQLELYGVLLDLDQLLPAPQGQREVGNSTTRSSPASVLGPVLLPFTGQAGLRFAQIVYRGLPFEDVKGQIILHAEQLQLKNLTARLAGGGVDLKFEAAIAQKLLPFSGQLSVVDLDLSKLGDALVLPSKGSISGILVADSRFDGFASQPDLLENLSVYGNFDLIEGEVKGSPLFNGLAKYLSSPQMQVLGFRRLHGSYGLKKRQGTLDAQLESRRLVIAPRGSFLLDGTLDLALETRISPALMVDVGFAGKGSDLFKDKNGWSLFPIRVKGRYSQPRFSLDSRGVKQQLKSGVERELGRQLQKTLGGRMTAEGDQPLRGLLDGTLNKLFGD